MCSSENKNKSENDIHDNNSASQLKCTLLPYTNVKKTFDLCMIGCEKPGIGSNEHDPSDNSCGDCALCCCPCALVLDILCIPFMCCGIYKVKNPN